MYLEALAMRRKLLGNEHPDVAGSLHNLASVLQARGDLAGAEQQFRRAIEKAPETSKAHRGLADVLRKRGQIVAANRELKLAEELQAKSRAAAISLQMGGR